MFEEKIKALRGQMYRLKSDHDQLVYERDMKNAEIKKNQEEYKKIAQHVRILKGVETQTKKRQRNVAS